MTIRLDYILFLINLYIMYIDEKHIARYTYVSGIMYAYSYITSSSLDSHKCYGRPIVTYLYVCTMVCVKTIIRRYTYLGDENAATV